MAEIIDGVAHVVDDDPNIRPQTPPGSWMEPIPESYRKKRGYIALGIGAAISTWLLVTQMNGNVRSVSFWVSAMPLAIGVWRLNFWFSYKEIKKYVTYKTILTKPERIRAARDWWIVGAFIWFVFWAISLGNRAFLSTWWVAPIPASLFLIIGTGIYLNREKINMTREAQLEFECKEAEKKTGVLARQLSSAWVDELNAVIGNPVIRYPIAIALVGLAVKLVHDSVVGALPVIVALGLAIWAAHELAKWLILFGLLLSAGYLLFHGVAALPVIAAVILVAMIIASAGNK